MRSDQRGLIGTVITYLVHFSLAGAIAIKCDGDPPVYFVPDGYQFSQPVRVVTTTQDATSTTVNLDSIG